MRFIVFTLLLGFSLSSIADTYVKGYQRRDGTYVQGHYKTESNNIRNDNYSTRGNSNPYTGSYGTKPRDGDYNYGSNRKRSRRGW